MNTLPRQKAFDESRGSSENANILLVIDCLAGLLLLVAGLAKAVNLPLFSKIFITLFGLNPAFSLVAANVVFATEMTLGVMLLAHMGNLTVQRTAAGLFTLFCAIQVARLLNGNGNPCGCFGLFQNATMLRPFSNPPLAATINLTFMAGLLRFDIASIYLRITSR